MLHCYIPGDVGILYFSALARRLLSRNYSSRSGGLNTLDQKCGLGVCQQVLTVLVTGLQLIDLRMQHFHQQIFLNF